LQQATGDCGFSLLGFWLLASGFSILDGDGDEAEIGDGDGDDGGGGAPRPHTTHPGVYALMVLYI
jgi:hypothetical protein